MRLSSLPLALALLAGSLALLAGPAVGQGGFTLPTLLPALFSRVSPPPRTGSTAPPPPRPTLPSTEPGGNLWDSFFAARSTAPPPPRDGTGRTRAPSPTSSRPPRPTGPAAMFNLSLVDVSAVRTGAGRARRGLLCVT